MAWERVEARRIRDIPWSRNVLPALALGLIAVPLRLFVSGLTPRQVALNSMWIVVFWFVVLGGVCIWRVWRDGVVVFSEPGWRRRSE